MLELIQKITNHVWMASGNIMELVGIHCQVIQRHREAVQDQGQIRMGVEAGIEASVVVARRRWPQAKWLEAEVIIQRAWPKIRSRLAAATIDQMPTLTIIGDE